MTAKIATPTTKGIGRKRLKARPPKMKVTALQPVVENQFRAAGRYARRSTNELLDWAICGNPVAGPTMLRRANGIDPRTVPRTTPSSARSTGRRRAAIPRNPTRKLYRVAFAPNQKGNNRDGRPCRSRSVMRSMPKGSTFRVVPPYSTGPLSSGRSVSVSGSPQDPGLKIPRVPYAGMTRIRFQGSLPHAGDSQPFWAPRAKERRPIFEGSLAVGRSRGCEELRDPNRIIRDGDSRLLECLDLRLRRATVPLDDRPRMAHPLPGRRRPASDVCHDRFRDPSLDEVRGLLLRRAADLADDDDSFCLAVFLKHREGVDHARADDRVPADPDAGRLSETGFGHGVHDLVGQRAAPRDHARVAFLEELVRHDSHLRLAGRCESGAIGSDDGAAAAAGIRHHVQTIVEWDSFRDDDDELESPFDRLDGGVLCVRRRDEDDGGVRPPPVDGLADAVEHRDPLDLRPRFARGDPGDHFRAEVDHRSRVELPLMPRDPLDEDPALLREEDRQPRRPPISV